MLTGDKVETATCIAISSHLFARNQPYFTLQARSKEEAEEQFNRFQKRPGACLIIDGASLSLCTDNFARQFIEVRSPAVSVTRPLHCVLLPPGPLKSAYETAASRDCCIHHLTQAFQVACNCPSVVCCRCAPTQKALIVRLLKLYAKKRCAAIGDGGNDVAMIQVRTTSLP
jgi:phospholipid-translocating ATPase